MSAFSTSPPRLAANRLRASQCVQTCKLRRPHKGAIKLANGTERECWFQGRTRECTRKPVVRVHVALLAMNRVCEQKKRLVCRMFAQVDKQSFERVTGISSNARFRRALGQINLLYRVASVSSDMMLQRACCYSASGADNASLLKILRQTLTRVLHAHDIQPLKRTAFTTSLTDQFICYTRSQLAIG